MLSRHVGSRLPSTHSLCLFAPPCALSLSLSQHTLSAHTHKQQRGIVTVLKQKWSPVQQRLLQKVLPVPFKFSNIMMEVEGMAAASTHPGDWRHLQETYE